MPNKAEIGWAAWRSRVGQVQPERRQGNRCQGKWLWAHRVDEQITYRTEEKKGMGRKER